MGFSRQEVGWVEEARTERDGEGTAGCASFRPTSWARAARPRAARGRRQAAVSTSKNRAARPRPNFAGAAERGANSGYDREVVNDGLSFPSPRLCRDIIHTKVVYFFHLRYCDP